MIKFAMIKNFIWVQLEKLRWNTQTANTDQERNCLEKKDFLSCSRKYVLPATKCPLPLSWLSRTAMLTNYSVLSSQDSHCLKDISIQKPRSYCLGHHGGSPPSSHTSLNKYAVTSKLQFCHNRTLESGTLKQTAICKLPSHSNVLSVSQERSPHKTVGS